MWSATASGASLPPDEVRTSDVSDAQGRAETQKSAHAKKGDEVACEQDPQAVKLDVSDLATHDRGLFQRSA